MKLSALLNGVGEISPSQDVEIENVTDKLSEVKENTLFICIDGDTFDGHSFVKQAISKGAKAVVAEKDTKASIQIKVNNSRIALSRIAANFYGNPAHDLKIIGITGTNGKTTTSYIVRHILNSIGESCGLIGTIENRVGTKIVTSSLTTPEPMELQKSFSEMVKTSSKYCVMEVSSQALSQYRTDGVMFSASAITNITPEHLNYHLNMENYISAKLKLFETSSVAVVNVDDLNIKNNLDRIKCKKVSVSLKNSSADYFASNIISSKNGVEFDINHNGKTIRAKLSLLGIYNVYNSICAVAILTELGYPFEKVVNALQDFNGVIGRCEKVPINTDFTVIIDYAHTPDGFEKILKSARDFTENRVITVFGCGGDRDKNKRPLMGEIASELSDIVVVTDDNPRTENPIKIISDILEGINCKKSQFAVVSGRKEAIKFALSIAKKGDTVLLLGKGHEKYQITSEGKIPFDEREIIKELYKQDEIL